MPVLILTRQGQTTPTVFLSILIRTLPMMNQYCGNGLLLNVLTT